METLQHCGPDDPFYEARARAFAPDPDLAWALPAGWAEDIGQHWRMLWPIGVSPRTHGWKVHLSAVERDYERVARAAFETCVRLGLGFKYVTSRSMLRAFNAKDADRASAGKLVTIYPRDDNSLEAVALDLDTLLDGVPSPYILGDVRFRRGPVYFRHGGFMALTALDIDGTEVPAVPDGSHQLVPDLRLPVFQQPDGALPPVVAQAVAAYRSVPEQSDLDRFDSIEPIQFSNSGGVYLVRTDRDTTVLKEARAHAGLDALGRDACERLGAEWGNLTRLAGKAIAPEPVRRFTAWEHDFIEVEYLSGRTLAARTVAECPLFQPSADSDDYARYAAETVLLLLDIARNVRATHAAGVVVGDLHPGNVMVLDDGSTRLIDLEDQRSLDQREQGPFNALGYGPPPGGTARAGDWFAMSRLVVSAFEPTFARELLTPLAWDETLRRVGRAFGSQIVDLVLEMEREWDGHDRGRARALRPTAEVIPWARAESDPQTTERAAEGLLEAWEHRGRWTIPGHPIGDDTTGGLNFERGVAGVAAALHRAGVDVPDSMLARLDHVRGLEHSELGLWRGALGVALTLQELGQGDAMVAVTERVRSTWRRMRSSTLADGLSGIAVGNADHDPALAVDLMNEVTRRAFMTASSPTEIWLDARPGLMHGWSGLAFAFAEVAHRTGAAHLLESARRAVARELRNVRRSGNAVVGLGEAGGPRAFPYLENGSAGLLTAFAALRRAHGVQAADALWAMNVPDLLRSCSATVFVFDGLLRGASGIVVGLAGHRQWSPDVAPVVDRISSSTWSHAVRWNRTLQFHGDDLLRLSADVGTGSAGVLLANLTRTSGGLPWLPGAHLARPTHDAERS